jgi:hypothetical protein
MYRVWIQCKYMKPEKTDSNVEIRWCLMTILTILEIERVLTVITIMYIDKVFIKLYTQLLINVDFNIRIITTKI